MRWGEPAVAVGGDDAKRICRAATTLDGWGRIRLGYLSGRAWATRAGRFTVALPSLLRSLTPPGFERVAWIEGPAEAHFLLAALDEALSGESLPRLFMPELSAPGGTGYVHHWFALTDGALEFDRVFAEIAWGFVFVRCAVVQSARVNAALKALLFDQPAEFLDGCRVIVDCHPDFESGDLFLRAGDAQAAMEAAEAAGETTRGLRFDRHGRPKISRSSSP